MIAPLESLTCVAEPPSAAPLFVYYPQFKQVDVPTDSKAVFAWKGTLRPFPDDVTAREVLRRLGANKPFEIRAGTAVGWEGSVSRHPTHWAEPLLLRMNLEFTVLVLEYADGGHARAFAVAPQISRQAFPMHPHLLDGISIQVRNQRLPALCVYSGAQFRYSESFPRIIEFLDQLTTYLARHMIWQRTRRLFEFSAGIMREVYVPRPGEFIIDVEPRLRTHPISRKGSLPFRAWDGYWPGTVAPQSPAEHLKTISPHQECWCCSGQPYGQCHRSQDLALRSN